MSDLDRAGTLANGADLRTVMALTGHTQPQTLLRHYAQAVPTTQPPQTLPTPEQQQDPVIMLLNIHDTGSCCHGATTSVNG